MRVVDLADEFGLTTAETIDACLWAGVAADGSAAELTDDEVARVRELMDGWNEAGFAPWHGDGTAAGVTSGASARRTGPAPVPSGGSAAAKVPPPASEPAVPPLASRRAGSAPATGADDDEFASRSSRLQRRESGAGLAGGTRNTAARPVPDLEGEAPPRTSGAPGGVGPAAAGIATAAGTAVASATTVAPDAPPPPRPAPPTEAPGAPAAAATPAPGMASTGTAVEPRPRPDAAAAPNDDFGPSGPETEVVGPTSIQRIGPALPPVQGGPTGWLPGGPDAKPHLAPLAIIALALAIASLAVPFVPAVIAIVLASVTKDRIDRSRGWLGGKPIATLAQVVAGIGVGLWLVLIIGSIFVQNRDSTAQAVPDIQVDRGTVGYSDIQVGDCVRLPRIGEIGQWRRVECADPHQGEVFATLVAGNPANQPYPGDSPIEATAKEGCRPKLADYAGTSADTSRLELGYAYPSALTWKSDNDRTIYCVAFRADGAPLSGSLKIPSTIPDAKSGDPSGTP